MTRFRPANAVTLALFGLVAACGSGAPPPGANMTGGSGGGGGGGSGGGGSGLWQPPACNPAATALASSRLWRLTDAEYVNAVRDVLGVELTGADAEITGPPDKSGEFTNLSEMAGPTTDVLTARYEAAAVKVADRASVPASMVALLGSSSPSTTDLETFISTKIVRLWRRPVAPDEVIRLNGIYQGGLTDGASQAFSLVIEAVLRTPSFLFRTEFGKSTPATTQPFVLTPFELATAASFLLTDSIPDDVLWGKALDGTVMSPDVLAAEVDRIAASPSAQRHLARYVSYWLWIERIAARDKDHVLFPEYTPTLRQALYDSGFSFVRDVVTGGTLSDLFTSPKIYVNDEMSAVYGIPGGSTATLEAVSTTLTERGAGILTQPATLAAANRHPAVVDVIRHGTFVLQNLLGGADLGSLGDTPIDSGAITLNMHGTEREIAAQRGAISRCAMCHKYIDPFGLTFYAYDAIGRHSATRYVFNDSTVMPPMLSWQTSPTPLDTSVEIADGVGSDLRGPLADVRALAQKLVADSGRRRVAYGAGRYLSTYAMGSDPNDANSCALQSVKQRFFESGSFIGFFADLVKSPAFAIRDPAK